jgi:catechol 2,3-dioxygenase-like lactoylglutathione lyase family enzyme
MGKSPLIRGNADVTPTLPPHGVHLMPAILKHSFVLAVHNVKASAKFYVDALGFHITADLGGWIFVAKDNTTLMLGECPDDPAPSTLGSHSYFAYLEVDNVDAYHAQLKTHLPNLALPADKPWGMRELPITTPDGHRLMLGQTIK